ncbi:MAG: DUF952 domain-containing protein [Bacteroidota bacterium]
MSIIYHITSKTEWNASLEKGSYKADTLGTEGFIHCSEEHQVAGVLERYYKDKTGLVKLVIDTGKLTSRLVKEWSPSTKEDFPHIYGPINTDAVIEVIEL